MQSVMEARGMQLSTCFISFDDELLPSGQPALLEVDPHPIWAPTYLKQCLLNFKHMLICITNV